MAPRAAYRLVDGLVLAIGTEEQGEAIESALSAAEKAGAYAARSHHRDAGSALARGDWAGSVRESINTVESMIRNLDPKASTLRGRSEGT